MPSSGATSIYGNSPEEIAKFFNFRHPNKFAVYKLAVGEDSSLPRDIFGARIRSQFGFLDQQPPPLVTPRIMNDRCKLLGFPKRTADGCSFLLESERADSKACAAAPVDRVLQGPFGLSCPKPQECRRNLLPRWQEPIRFVRSALIKLFLRVFCVSTLR